MLNDLANTKRDSTFFKEFFLLLYYFAMLHFHMIQKKLSIDSKTNNNQTTKVVHKKVSQGCNLIKRSEIFKITRHKSGLV